jgi:hypothetical protein
LAYYLSISKGINPDKPKNLAKVVTVEWKWYLKSKNINFYTLFIWITFKDLCYLRFYLCWDL